MVQVFLGCNLARNLFHAGKDVTLLAREKIGRENQEERTADQRSILPPHRSAILQRRSKKRCVKDSRNRRYENDQTTVKVSGMACSMCEAHINDAIRAAFSVKDINFRGDPRKSRWAKMPLRAAINATGFIWREIAPQSTKERLFPFREETVGSFRCRHRGHRFDIYIFYMGGQSL